MNRWQIFSAIAIKRLPELKPQADPIEARVQHVFTAYEMACSRYSEHELQILEDKRLAESQDADIVIKETAQDREDNWLKNSTSFAPGQYDERLTKLQLLFIKSKFGSDIKDQWLLPQLAYDSQKDETLIETARRALRESLNIINGYTIVGKVPMSVCSFKYPQKVVPLTGYQGAKVFYINAHLDQPSPQVLEALDPVRNSNIKWWTIEEATGSVEKDYLKSLVSGLPSEARVDIKRVIERAKQYSDRRNKLLEDRARC